MTPLHWLEEWFAARCNGDWPRRFGLRIATLENPGWSIEIPLTGTPLETRDFQRIVIDHSDTDWLDCWVERRTFYAAAGPNKLGAVVRIFRAWNEGSNHPVDAVLSNDVDADSTLRWLEAWFAALENAVDIDSLDNPGWWVRIDLVETPVQNLTLNRIHTARSPTDWLRYWVEAGRFEATCGPRNLTEALETFRDWFDRNRQLEIRRVGHEMASVCRRVLDGSLDPIEGIRAVVVLDEGAGRIDDPVLASFRTWYPKVDKAPRGDQRSELAPAYLRRLEAEEAEYVAGQKAEILRACRDIVEKFEGRGSFG